MQPLGWEHNDAFQMQFILQHYFDGGLLELPMFFGIPNILLYNEHFILHAIVALPFYLLTHNITITYNLLVFTVLALSFGAMYGLVVYLTKNRWASVVAGLIFVFNPFVFARFPGHLNLLTLCFIPLIFLYFEKSLASPTNKNLFLFFAAAAGQLLTSWYYVGILAVLFPVYALMRLRETKIALISFLRPGLYAGIALCALVGGATLALYGPFLAGGSLDKTEDRMFQEYFSAWPTDWFLAPPSNVLYGSLRPWVAKRFPSFVHTSNPSEQNLLVGITPFLLAMLALSTKRRPIIVVGVISFLLSFGPALGLYSIVHDLYPPMWFLRVPARFAVGVFFAVSVLSGYAVAHVLKKRHWVIGLLLAALIALEYWNTPPATRPLPPTPQVYEALQSLPVAVVLEFPIANQLPVGDPRRRVEYLDAHYLWYRLMYHKKKLFNGYAAFTPGEAMERNNFLAATFPSAYSLATLRSWGVGAVILHRDEFTMESDYMLIKTQLAAQNVPLIVEEAGMALFDLTKSQ